VITFGEVINIKHESDIETLRKVALMLDRENKRLTDRIGLLQNQIRKLSGEEALSKQQELEILKEILASRESDLFGDSSEKRKRPDGNGEPAGAGETKKPQRGHGPQKQLALEVIEEIHELHEDDLTCRVCGGQFEEMQGQFEESEEITSIERQFVILKHKRKKYRCRCNACVETAPGPVKLKAGCRYSPEFAIDVAVDKYVDHMPLQRQVKAMKRAGLIVKAQTLWDQLESLAKWLDPTYRAILQQVLESPLVHADETRWPMLGSKYAPKEKRWMWAVANEELVAYRILKDRSTESARKILGGYSGILMSDAYGAYGALARDGPQMKMGSGDSGVKIKLVHCWAHCRRKYFKVEPNYPEQCKEILDLIGELYEVESQVPSDLLGIERLVLHAKLRDEKSREITDKIKKWAESQRVLPESGLGRAIRYMLGIWSELTEFLEDPLIPLDNNHLERALRPPVVGRKNHYGSRSDRGTHVAELFYTLVESAKLNGIDPKEYLQKATWRALKKPGAVTLPDLSQKRALLRHRQDPSLLPASAAPGRRETLSQ
jgi:transposase